jgi:hypothetical protein
VIRLPRRSVTRFFIPLIDVLILLFAIFLLMPYVSDPLPQEPEEKSKAGANPAESALPDDVRELQRLLQEERRRVARMEEERKRRLSEGLHVCVLQIDPQDGTLYYHDSERQDIRTESDALRLIARQKALASTQGAKDLYFLILWPRVPSAFPTQAQEAQYRQWFRDVPMGFDQGHSNGKGK